MITQKLIKELEKPATWKNVTKIINKQKTETKQQK